MASIRKNIVVVLNYNDWEETKRYCEVVKNFPSVDQIVVVDNKSTDNSIEELKRISSTKVVIIEATENKGYAAGNNVGLKYILEQNINANIIISNPDIYYTNEILEKVLEPLKDPTIGISTGLIHIDGKIASNFGWMQPGFWDLFFNQYLLIYKLNKLTHNSFYCDYPKEDVEYVYCNCVSGCFFCMTTETLKQIGLFDESTFLYGEENIIGFKIKENGQKACVVTSASIEHRHHHSIKKSKTSYKRNERWKLDSFLIYIKNYLKKGKIHQILFRVSFWGAYHEKKIIGKIINLISQQ